MQLKFRAYNKRSNVMMFVQDIDFSIGQIMGEHIIRSQVFKRFWDMDDAIIEQYIGTQDDYGHDIYQGDLVLVTVGDEYTIDEVVYNGPHSPLAFDLKEIEPINGHNAIQEFVGMPDETIQVIGNIHEGIYHDDR